jgi:hypothetical protein
MSKRDQVCPRGKNFISKSSCVRKVLMKNENGKAFIYMMPCNISLSIILKNKEG